MDKQKRKTLIANALKDYQNGLKTEEQYNERLRELYSLDNTPEYYHYLVIDNNTGEETFFTCLRSLYKVQKCFNNTTLGGIAVNSVRDIKNFSVERSIWDKGLIDSIMNGSNDSSFDDAKKCVMKGVKEECTDMD